MADPLAVVCLEGVWTRVALSVKDGNVALKNDHIKYLQTYRETGEDAPSDLSDAMPVRGDGSPIASNTAIDVYIYAQTGDGEVIVSV